MDSKLTPQQIENWRKILSVTFGPYAFFMPAAEVQKMRDAYQRPLPAKEPLRETYPPC